MRSPEGDMVYIKCMVAVVGSLLFSLGFGVVASA